MIYINQIIGKLSLLDREYLNLKELEQYIKKSCISAPSSIFEEIKKLEPGQTLKFDATKFNFSVSHYWVVKDIIQKETKRRSIKLDNTSAKKSTLNILKEVVDSQIISDVPIGAFLSGGIDSTLISAIANDSLGGKLNTFSISFDDKSFDESEPTFGPNMSFKKKLPVNIVPKKKITIAHTL